VTRVEFDTWIEQHYSELLKVARKRVNTDDEALEVVQAAVATMLTNQFFLTSEKPWTYATKAVRSYARDHREVRGNLKTARKQLRIEEKISRSTLSHGWKRPAPRAE
jgi:DNA-directed RNA polymerase specialized sigma24 family protein